MIKEKVIKRGKRFRKKKGYTAPYWQLVRFAEEVIEKESD